MNKVQIEQVNQGFYSSEPAEQTKQVPAETNPTDIFKDLGALRKASVVTVKRRQVFPAIKVIDKPASNLHFRVNPDPEMMLQCTLVVDDEGGGKKFYFIAPSLRSHPKVSVRLRNYVLRVICTYPGGLLMLWPVPMLGTGRDFPVWRSYDKAAKMAETEWVSMVWSSDHRDYIIERAEGELPEPDYGQRSLTEMLMEGFSDCVADNEEHPFMRRVRGLE
jgi:hypothetical protein